MIHRMSICFTIADEPVAAELQDWLFEQGMEVADPGSRAPFSEAGRFHRDFVRCDAVVVYFGEKSVVRGWKPSAICSRPRVWLTTPFLRQGRLCDAGEISRSNASRRIWPMSSPGKPAVIPPLRPIVERIKRREWRRHDKCPGAAGDTHERVKTDECHELNNRHARLQQSVSMACAVFCPRKTTCSSAGTSRSKTCCKLAPARTAWLRSLAPGTSVVAGKCVGLLPAVLGRHGRRYACAWEIAGLARSRR